MANREPDKFKVFISYSRRDAVVADALVEALTASGFEVAIDRRDIPFGEKWQGELAEFIRLCDTVIWLVSDASVQSKWVNWELDEVSRRSKRLVPIMIKETARDGLPRQLGEIHILPPEGLFDLERDLGVLVHVLETDRGWLKQASRLQDRATEWISKGRPSALLLSGWALSDAESWKERRPPKTPAPAKEILDLLHASRQAATRRLRAWVFGSSLAATLAVALALFAFFQRGIARDRAVVAQSRLVQLMVDHGKRHINEGSLLRAWRWFAEALIADTAIDSAKEEAHRQRIGGTRAQLPELAINEVAGKDHMMVRFSPDGARVIAADRDGGIHTIEVAEQKIQDLSAAASSSQPCSLEKSAFLHSDPMRMVLVKTCADDNRRWMELHFRDFVSPVPFLVRAFPTSGDIAFSADGARALLVPEGKGGPDVPQEVTVYDVFSWQPIVHLHVGGSPARGAISGDGRVAAILSGHKIGIYRVDAQSGDRPVREYELGDEPNVWSSMVLSSDGRFLVASAGKQLRQWQVDRDELILRHVFESYARKLVTA